jgi:integrase
MARTPTVWLRKDNGFFYTTLRGEKIKLSQDRKEAQKLFHTLMAKDEKPTGPAISMTFRWLADLYLDEVQRIRRPNTYRVYRYVLQTFCDRVGGKRVADLRVLHATEWVNAHEWNESTCCSARTALLACLNWGVTQGHIDSHPLQKLKRGSHKRRERVLTPEERQKIRDGVKPDFRDFLFALEQTGARPFSEMARITAAMVDWQTSTITLTEHKNAAKGKPRTIYLTPEVMALLERLARERPTGLLFRNSKGNIWTSHDATRRLHHITDKLGLARATIYAFRHSAITEALERGLTANVIAELVGNSAITITRNYDHLSTKRQTMLDAARKAVGG